MSSPNDGEAATVATPHESLPPAATGIEMVAEDNEAAPMSTQNEPKLSPQEEIKDGAKEGAKQKRALTEEELATINDPVKFREFCVTTQRDMFSSLRDVHQEQKQQKIREGELAAHVALLALENAKLQEQYKNKTTSRAIAKKMNDLASAAGVDPIDLETFAVEHLGAEGGMDQAAALAESKIKAKKIVKANADCDAVSTSSSAKRPAGSTAINPQTAKKQKKTLDSDPRGTDEDANMPDEDGITVHGNMHSRENNVIISRWGFRGTGIKGKPGCIIRLTPGTKLALSSSVTKAAKAAAAEVVASKADRLNTAKGFGETIFKYVDIVLNSVVDKKKDHSPFFFEDLVDVPDAVSARTVNEAQPLIWRELMRDAYANMGLEKVALGVPLEGVKVAISLLRTKLIAMGKEKKGARVSNPPSSSTSKDKDKEEDDAFGDF